MAKKRGARRVGSAKKVKTLGVKSVGGRGERDVKGGSFGSIVDVIGSVLSEPPPPIKKSSR